MWLELDFLLNSTGQDRNRGAVVREMTRVAYDGLEGAEPTCPASLNLPGMLGNRPTSSHNVSERRGLGCPRVYDRSNQE